MGEPSMEAGSTFQAEGLVLNLSPDPAGVVMRVSMTGALAGLSRRITLPVELAAELHFELGRAIRTTRDMQQSFAPAWLCRVCGHQASACRCARSP